jgi:hypothetical protein
MWSNKKPVCKLCDRSSNLITPCGCVHNNGYVHNKCLVDSLKPRTDSDQDEIRCTACNTYMKYDVKRLVRNPVQNFIEALSALLYLMQMIFPYVFLVISHGRIVNNLRRYNMWSLNNLTIREMIKVEVKFRNARIPPSLQYFLENLKKDDITHQFDDITICTFG